MHLITVFIVNLTLHMVSRQLKKKIRLETRKQDESCQNIQDARERERERRREKNQVGKEKRLRKKNKKKKTKKNVSRKKLLMYHLKVILILWLKNISSEIIHADVVLIGINDAITSISSRIVEQIEVIPESVLSKVSKLINSMMSKKLGDQRKLSFREEKGLRKMEN